MNNNKVAYLIFELGSIQVFTYKTLLEIHNNNEEYKEVYWQDKVSKYTYGPFPTVYDCMTHYTKTIASQKKSVIGEEHNAPIIYMDFKKKSRIVYRV